MPEGGEPRFRTADAALALGFAAVLAALAPPAWHGLRSAIRRGDLLQNDAPLVRALADHWRAHGSFPVSAGAVNPPWDLVPRSSGAPGTLLRLRWDLPPWSHLESAAADTTPTRVRFAYFAQGEGPQARAWLYAIHDFDGDGSTWNGLGWDCTRLWIASSGAAPSVVAERSIWRGSE